MFGLNGKQWLSISAAVLAALMLSTAQLTDVFGPTLAKTIVSVSALGSMLLNAISTALASQGNTVKDVLAMPGVEKLTVNEQANQTLATIAVDPLRGKIEPATGADMALQATAKGNG